MAEALNLRKEPAQSFERYGATAANQARGGRAACEAVLIARRLLEAGVPFVDLRLLLWDFHDHHDDGCRNNFPCVDNAVASLIEDLDQRGLLHTTSVALLGEMGRTPWRQGGGAVARTIDPRSSWSWPEADSAAVPSSVLPIIAPPKSSTAPTVSKALREPSTTCLVSNPTASFRLPMADRSRLSSKRPHSSVRRWCDRGDSIAY